MFLELGNFTTNVSSTNEHDWVDWSSSPALERDQQQIQQIGESADITQMLSEIQIADKYPTKRAIMLSPRFRTKRLQTSCQAQQTDKLQLDHRTIGLRRSHKGRSRLLYSALHQCTQVATFSTDKRTLLEPFGRFPPNSAMRPFKSTVVKICELSTLLDVLTHFHNQIASRTYIHVDGKIAQALTVFIQHSRVKLIRTWVKDDQPTPPYDATNHNHARFQGHCNQSIRAFIVSEIGDDVIAIVIYHQRALPPFSVGRFGSINQFIGMHHKRHIRIQLNAPVAKNYNATAGLDQLNSTCLYHDSMYGWTHWKPTCIRHSCEYHPTIDPTISNPGSKLLHWFIASTIMNAEVVLSCTSLCVNVIKLPQTPTVIGGPGLRVEIDKTLISRRKNHAGIFGGICRETKEMFMYAVPDRTAATLVETIQACIAPGSIILSDMWASTLWIQRLELTHKPSNLFGTSKRCRINTNAAVTCLCNERVLHPKTTSAVTKPNESIYTYVRNALLTRLLKILRQPTTGFALPLGLIRRLNVLHQAASCSSCYDIQDIKNWRFSWVPYGISPQRSLSELVEIVHTLFVAFVKAIIRRLSENQNLSPVLFIRLMEILNSPQMALPRLRLIRQTTYGLCASMIH
ncbi:hypothetical protein CLF_111264 [Clonorchis sinensis]|uniref:ISXO2-like transposase domain-containing protein n=1 Tax=Clonorchis sinensis TaxID=79923 RepID=G7YUJ8_CLOSI|nr:hypothetical protein CLF_111264 [Clonorchis sinensis]